MAKYVHHLAVFPDGHPEFSFMVTVEDGHLAETLMEISEYSVASREKKDTYTPVANDHTTARFKLDGYLTIPQRFRAKYIELGYPLLRICAVAHGVDYLKMATERGIYYNIYKASGVNISPYLFDGSYSYPRMPFTLDEIASCSCFVDHLIPGDITLMDIATTHYRIGVLKYS